MQSRQPFQGKERIGRITLELVQAKYLRIRTTFKGKSYTKNVGTYSPAQPSPAVLKAARATAQELDSHLTFGRYQEFVDFFQSDSLRLELVQPCTSPDESKKTQIKLGDLWERFTAHQATHLEQSTIKRDYRLITNRISKLATQDIEQASEIRDELLANYSAEVSRRTLAAFSRCCNWGMDSGLIQINPFGKLAAGIKRVRTTKKTRKSFTPAERDAILQAFQNNTYCPKTSAFKHSHYWGFVAFMFYSGCRIQDVQALKWKHIKADRATGREYVVFSEAFCSDVKLTKRGKTNTIRPFPINDQLRSILDAAKEATTDHSPNALVFPSFSGKPIDRINFGNRIWKPVIEGLIRDGKVSEFLPPNNCRHTFISLCIEKGMDAKDIAPLCGNSAKTIYENYASKKKDIVVPVL